MDKPNLYSQDLVRLANLDQFSQEPQHPTHSARVTSAICGDDIELFLQLDQTRCVQVGIKAQACVVCRAAAHLMCEALVGQEASPFLPDRAALEQAIAGQPLEPDHRYHSFAVLARFPSRVGCALLPWKALERALEQRPLSSARPVPPATAALPLAPSAFAAIEQWRAKGQRVALATLIAVDGSSPAPLGSRMAIAESGEFWGSVSGGCVESAIVAAALELLDQPDELATQLLSFQIANSQAGEVGLPCGGQIQVHLCRAPSSKHITACEQAAKAARPSYRIYTVNHTRPQIVALDDLDHRDDTGLPNKLVELMRAEPAALELWQGPQEHYVIEPLLAAPTIVMVGGTHIAQQLSLLAQSLNYACVVIEPRASLANAARFPGAKVIAQPVSEALRPELSSQSAVVMLTHEPRLDDPAITLALDSPAFYVGALGSRKTQRARLDRLKAQGICASKLSKIHGPVGLSIGAKGAGEIALSILAQIVSTRRGQAQRPARIGAVILAAGSSTRFGASNKLLSDWQGQPLVRSVVRKVIAAGIGPCVVVLGHEGHKVKAALSGLDLIFVEHTGHQEGMGTSVAAGFEAMAKQEVDASFVVLADMPKVRIEDYEALAAAHRSSTQHLIVAPEAGQGKQRRLGNPILWPRRYFEDLQKLRGDRGAKALLLDAPGAVLRLHITHEGVLKDIDTPQDLP